MSNWECLFCLYFFTISISLCFHRCNWEENLISISHQNSNDLYLKTFQNSHLLATWFFPRAIPTLSALRVGIHFWICMCLGDQTKLINSRTVSEILASAQSHHVPYVARNARCIWNFGNLNKKKDKSGIFIRAYLRCSWTLKFMEKESPFFRNNTFNIFPFIITYILK